MDKRKQQKPDVRARVRTVAQHLHHVADLMLFAADGPEPDRGLRYLADLTDELQPGKAVAEVRS